MNLRKLLRRAARRDRYARMAKWDGGKEHNFRSDGKIANQRREFYAAVERGDNQRARNLAELFHDFAEEPVERVRWRKWLEALQPGHRVIIKTYPAEIVAGEALEELDRIRRAETPADLVKES